jgi:hypothetical protein
MMAQAPLVEAPEPLLLVHAGIAMLERVPAIAEQARLDALLPPR